MAGPGGRIPPDGRPPQAKGVGKNAKRHDLEKPKTPGLHGSDLQQGDVQAMEQGQRIAPAQTQGQAAPEIARQSMTRSPNGDETSSMQIPDAIDFLGSQQAGGEFELPQSVRPRVDVARAQSWLPILRQLVGGPGSSGALAAALITQARNLSQVAAGPAVYEDLQGIDDGIEAMLDVGVRSEQDFSEGHRAVPMPAGNPDHFTEGQGQPGLGRVNPKSYRPQGGSA